MEYNKSENNIVLSNFETKELLALMKMQIKMAFVFFIHETKKKRYIYLGERVLDGREQKITVLLDKKEYVMSYQELLETISELMRVSTFTIEISIKEFGQNESLIVLANSIKQEIIDNCVYLSYDKKVGVFGLINRDTKGVPNKIYYYEDNNSILTFNNQGPEIFVSEKITSVEDILC